MTITRSRVLEARVIANKIPRVLRGRGLKPAFGDWVLVEDAGMVWLFGVLQVERLEKLERYTAPALLHHLSTAAAGRPVYLSNTSGLRYAVLISQPPRLPRCVDFPGMLRGSAVLGQRYTGEPVSVPWSKMGHLLIAGKTGAGKSNFLRLLVYQARAEGFRLALGDLDGSTFPMLAEDVALLTPLAREPSAMVQMLARVAGECEARAELYAQTEGFPDSLEEYNSAIVRTGGAALPRVLVVLDEFNAAVLAAGGARGPLAQEAAALGWSGRKYGVHLVFAAQEFTKSVLGSVRDQVAAAICFRVRSAASARMVGCTGAERIPESRPGLAMTDRWGPLQAYFLDKRLLIKGAGGGGTLLTEQERETLQRAEENGGRMSIPLLKGWGMTERAARRMLSEWELRGWVRRDPQRQNARYLTGKLAFDEVDGA